MDPNQVIKKQIGHLTEQIKEMRQKKSQPGGTDSKGTRGWLAHEAKQKKLLSLCIKVKKQLKGHFGKVYAMHWSEAQQRQYHLVSASQDGKLIIWNAFTNHKIDYVILRSSWVMTCAFSPSATQVACGGLDNLCSVYKLEDAKVPNETRKPIELNKHDGYLSCCRFIDDERIVTTSGDMTCIVWDINEEVPSLYLNEHDADVMSVALHGKNTLVTGSCDHSAKLWDIRAGGKCVMDFRGMHDSDINSVAFFPDGKAFGTGSDNSAARVIDLRSQAQLAKFCDELKTGTPITSVDFSSTGKVFFAGYDDFQVNCWDVLSGCEKAQVLSGHQNRVSCLGVSRDGKALCTGSWDAILRIWA